MPSIATFRLEYEDKVLSTRTSKIFVLKRMFSTVTSYSLSSLDSNLKVAIIQFEVAGLAWWWERTPPTNVSRVRFPTRCHMWIEFVGSLLCSVRFIPRFSGSPLSPKTNIWIGHFRVHLSLRFKARLSAKSLIWKSVFIHIEIGTNYHNKSFALRLALKERLRGTRKWPIWSVVI